MAQCNKTLQNYQDSIAFPSGAKMVPPPGPGIAYYTSLMMVFDVTQTDYKTNGYTHLLPLFGHESHPMPETTQLHTLF